HLTPMILLMKQLTTQSMARRSAQQRGQPQLLQPPHLPLAQPPSRPPAEARAPPQQPPAAPHPQAQPLLPEAERSRNPPTTPTRKSPRKMTSPNVCRRARAPMAAVATLLVARPV